MSTKWVWAGSGATLKSTWAGSHNDVDIAHTGYQILADSFEWAYGYAMRDLTRRYPPTDGWVNHHVVLEGVPSAIVAEWFEAMQDEPAGSER